MRVEATVAIRHRPTVAVVDLDAIRDNVRVLKPQGAEVMAVVKANGYGHGAAPVARAALEAGATWLGVALVEEGTELRDAGLSAPVLVLTEFPPGSEREALAARLTPTVYTREALARLAHAAGLVQRPVGVHVKIDTGMHRAGLPPEDAAGFLVDVRRSGLEIEGLWTHLAVADEPDDPFTQTQLQRFRTVVEGARKAGTVPRYLHAANSAAMLSRPDSHFNLVRPGLAVYGLAPGPRLPGVADLRPALTWRSAVSLTKRVAAGEAISYGQRYRLDRPATIATVPVGYADGFRWALGEGGEVLIRGRRRPVAGSVTMDQIMDSCQDDPVAMGDEVVLIGRQGAEWIRVEELAVRLATIPYEVVCGLSERVPRVYLGS
jgi:alanine racemase